MSLFCKRRRISAPGTYKVTIKGNGAAAYCYVTIGEDQYTKVGEDGVEVSVDPGTVLKASIRKNPTWSKSPYVSVDGTQVLTNSSYSSTKHYEYEVYSDVEVELSYVSGAHWVTITRV